MSFSKYLLILILFFLTVIFYYFNKPSLEYKIEFPIIPEKELNKLEQQSVAPFEEQNLADLENIFQESITQISKRVDQTPAWSIRVNSYPTYEECIEDFKILNEEGFKVYVRKEYNNKEISFVLLIGPNLDKLRLKEIQDQVRLVLNKNSNIVPYKN